jgi:hypothetical protein
MKKLSILFFLLTTNIMYSSTWYISDTCGDNIVGNGTPVFPYRDITFLFATGIVNDGDTIYVDVGTYNDTPNINKNVFIYGWNGCGVGVEVVFDLSAGNMVFSMSGTTQFYNGTLTRFYFKGSTTAGIWIQSGKVLLATAVFYIEPPFLFQGCSTDIFEVTEGLPTKYQLSQNYPNPFNPTTTINYSIPSSQFVNITAFDICGKEIECLVNEEKLPGYYEVKFDGRNLSSGIYFYQIRTGQFSETKKFILLK